MYPEGRLWPHRGQLVSGAVVQATSMMRRASARQQIKSSFSSRVRWCGLASESPEPGVQDDIEKDTKLSHRKLGRTT